MQGCPLLLWGGGCRSSSSSRSSKSSSRSRSSRRSGHQHARLVRQQGELPSCPLEPCRDAGELRAHAREKHTLGLASNASIRGKSSLGASFYHSNAPEWLCWHQPLLESQTPSFPLWLCCAFFQKCGQAPKTSLPSPLGQDPEGAGGVQSLAAAPCINLIHFPRENSKPLICAWG